MELQTSIIKEQRKNKEWYLTEIFNWENGVRHVYKTHPEIQMTREEILKAQNGLKLFDIVESIKVKIQKELPYLSECHLEIKWGTRV